MIQVRFHRAHWANSYGHDRQSLYPLALTTFFAAFDDVEWFYDFMYGCVAVGEKN